jgi:hypothetical protein
MPDPVGTLVGLLDDLLSSLFGTFLDRFLDGIIALLCHRLFGTPVCVLTVILLVILGFFIAGLLGAFDA